MKTNGDRVVFIVLIITLLMILTGCVPGDGSYTQERPAGFFLGMWHGCIAPVSLLIGVFNERIRVYEPMNTGWGYDFGFFLGVTGLLSGAAGGIVAIPLYIKASRKPRS